jgi:hypothetical protein
MDAPFGEVNNGIRPRPRLPPVTIAILVFDNSAFVVVMVSSFSCLIYLKLTFESPDCEMPEPS